MVAGINKQSAVSPFSFVQGVADPKLQRQLEEDEAKKGAQYVPDAPVKPFDHAKAQTQQTPAMEAVTAMARKYAQPTEQGSFTESRRDLSATVQNMRTAVDEMEDRWQESRAKLIGMTGSEAEDAQNLTLVDQGDSISEAIRTGLDGLSQAERRLSLITQKAQARQADLGEVLTLDELLQQYSDQDEMSEEDWNEKIEPHMDAARKHGVTYEKKGWGSAKERESLKRGVENAERKLNSMEKIDVLELQQATHDLSLLFMIISSLDAKRHSSIEYAVHNTGK